VNATSASFDGRQNRFRLLLHRQLRDTFGTIAGAQPVTSKSFLLLAALLCASVLPAQQAQYKKNGPVLLPDPAVTQGAIRLSNKSTICATKWGKDERHVTPKMKQDAYAQYGTAAGQGVCAFKTHTGANGQSVTEGCEIDHLISRELGGDDTLDNLWPQPYTQHPGAHEKDWLENELHKEVCAGKITLADAQQEIKVDWYAAYSKRKQP
jgi:5-methylcytosine-specific restriction endonuclease McrA